MAIVVLLLLFTVTSVYARSVAVELVNIEAEVNADGSMDVVENYMVDFEGQWNGMFRWIHLRNNMEITNIRVEEDGRPLERNPGTDYGPPGTFFIRDEGNRVFVDWSLDAINTVRTYTFRYQVENAVFIHNDVAELYYQFIGDEWEIPFDHVRVTLTLPEGADMDEIRAWGHGPLSGEVTILSSTQVQWQVAPLASNTMLEGRVVMPLALVPQGTNETGREALPEILDEEEAWARQANRIRLLARIEIVLAPLIVLGSAVLFYLKRRRFKRAYTPQFQGDYYRELPAEYTPAVLGQLWNKEKDNPEIVMATILDLARRKYLMIQEFVPEKKGFFRRGRDKDYALISQGKPLNELKDYEKKLLELLFQDVGMTLETTEGAQVSLGDLEDYTKSKKNRLHFASQYRDFCTKVGLDASRQRFFERASGKFVILNGVLLLGMVGLGIAVIALFRRYILGAGLVIGGALGIVMMAGLRRYSRQGQEDYLKWKAFRQFLTDFSAMDQHEIPSLAIWEHYLVYAVPLGVAKEVIQQLQLVFPNMEQDGYRFGAGWYMSRGMMNYQQFDSFISTTERSVTTSIRDSVRAAASQSSSGSGGGGGFSGGGGGGSGGGGGGFR